MSEPDELAQRYLALWTEYLAALLANPQAIETLKRWMAFTSQFSYPEADKAEAGGAPFPTWPPFFGPFGPPPVPPSANDVSAVQRDGMAELVRRVDELEHRLAALERAPKPRRARREVRDAGD
jgi:hypothetical protein